MPPPSAIPGIHHRTLASGEAGFGVSVWQQSIEPGHGTPLHSHDCDEVVTVRRGTCQVRVGATVYQFSAGATIVLPAAQTHQIVSCGAEPLELLAVFPDSPVMTRAPDGSLIALPWPS
jgi:quercetin dioxygenase-like cupin family protein